MNSELRKAILSLWEEQKTFTFTIKRPQDIGKLKKIANLLSVPDTSSIADFSYINFSRGTKNPIDVCNLIKSICKPAEILGYVNRHTEVSRIATPEDRNILTEFHYDYWFVPMCYFFPMGNLSQCKLII